jgi:hypothetical protein
MHNAKLWKFAVGSLLIIAAMMIGMGSGIAANNETITGQMYGTSTQMGRNVGFKIIVYKPSTAEDRAALVDAFKKGQSQGLAKKLEKMKAVGHITITGALGYDVTFIRVIPTETGRTIRFVTNRKIAFGEARNTTRSLDYNLTAGEIKINDKNPKKSEGTLFPAAQLIINKEGEVQWDLYQNPWRISGIKDWNPPKAH